MAGPTNPFVVRIPHTNLGGAGADMRSRLVTWEWRERFPPGTDSLILDFTENKFIEPWALALYAAYALRVSREHAIPVRAALDPANSANQYVEKMGFTHVLSTGESTPSWDTSHDNTGLHVIKTHRDVTRFIGSASLLARFADDETIDALKYGMAELGRNVVQHSASGIGGIAMAQYFPSRKCIQISVADCGQGILLSLSGMYPELKTDLEALKLSVLPHVSGTFRNGLYSAGDNAGLGLFFVKEICWRTGGTFWLVSQRALLGVTGKDIEGRNKIYRQINRWSGTSVTMDIPAVGIADFGGLLEICRSLANSARLSPGGAGLDFIDELPELEGLSVIRVADFIEDVEAAALVRDTKLLPAMEQGGLVVLDFAGVRFATQSFVHALLSMPLRVRGSLCRLSFLNCTRSTEQAIRLVAAYTASYDQI